MFTVGVTVATVVSLLERLILVPLAGAGPFNVIVPVAVRVRPTDIGFGLREIDA
jgi:hypothetical protein